MNRIRWGWAASLSLGSAFLIAPAWAQTGTTAIPAPRDQPYLGTMRLQVDATDTDRRIFKVREQLPVAAGPLTLLFPRFLPGHHGPYGEVDRLAGLLISAGGKPVPWVRDTVNPYAFHLDVPPGAAELELSFQFLSAVSKDSGSRVQMTPAMVSVQWNDLLLYPAGYSDRSITVQPSLQVPSGWSIATALTSASQQRSTGTTYAPVTLETLVDSPALAGANLRRVELDPPGKPNPVVLDIVADEPSQLDATEEQLQAHRNLVIQADRLYGSRHFRHYDFLLSLSTRLGFIGLEHHESSEDGVTPEYFKDWAKRSGGRDLLPHEYTHSWNGKFRRPADLWTASFEVPMQNSLLWVYEGQTQYWGRLLAARSGLVTIDETHNDLANVAAALDARAGRVWRNLQDTTNEGTLGLAGRGKDWRNWQRGVDYYDESTLIWMDADTLIREQSGGTKSLDDFALAFFGVDNGRIQPLTYTFDDVVTALNQVWPYGWAAFLRERLDTHRPGAPLDGLARAGWRLAWAETPSDFSKNEEPDYQSDDFAYSLGFYLKHEGMVDSVLWESPAFKAGLTKGQQILAVNGTAYKMDRLSTAITANKAGKAPIDLLVKDGESYRTLHLDYRGGLRYPRLERIPGTVERLDSGLLAARP